MALIAAAPFVLTDATLMIALDNYETHVSAVEFVPSAPSVNWKGLGGNSFTATGTASWVCNIAYAQDWETANSLARYLLDNEGTSVVVEFYPEAGGTGFTATLVITPGAIGGTVDSVAVGSVSLGVQGKPAEITV